MILYFSGEFVPWHVHDTMLELFNKLLSINFIHIKYFWKQVHDSYKFESKNRTLLKLFLIIWNLIKVI